MAEIIFTAGPYEGNKLELPETGIVIGRSQELSNLAINDGQISSRHASLRRENGKWIIEDLGSSNGTEVNGMPVKIVELKTNDKVTIGSTSFTFIDNIAETAQEAVLVASLETPPEPQDALPPEENKQAEIPPAPTPQETVPPAQEPTAPNIITNKEKPSDTGLATEEDLALVQKMKDYTVAIRNEISKVIVGQREVLDQVLMCMIAGGHALLIGLPGMAKTLTVSTIAKVLDMKFKRVQFTPDLMPTDIIGSDVLETNKQTGEKEFRFIKGPIFCNLLLADEINRTPPKTQAALLEAMQEKRVTAGNTTYTLDKPFFVLATQNPIEQEGTYPLPEAQLDRFMFNIWVDYPLQHEEEQIIAATTSGKVVEPQKILDRNQVIQLQEVVRKIPVSDHVVKYVIKLVRATRPQYEDAPQITKTYIGTGAGPRAGQNLVLAAKARAVLEGRIHVSCNDIRRAAIPVLRHRIITNFAADSEGLTTMDIIKKLIEEIKEPGAEDYVPAPATINQPQQQAQQPKQAPVDNKKKKR